MRLITSKVRAHRTWAHVRAGLISADHKIRNARADQLAGQGADGHAAVIQLVQDAARRKADAKQRHRLMLDIVNDRDLMLTELPAHVVNPPVGTFARRVRRRLA